MVFNILNIFYGIIPTRASSNDDKHEFSRLSTLMYKVLEWHVNALGTALEFAILWEEQKRQVKQIQ
jgi:hypothetical protein